MFLKTLLQGIKPYYQAEPCAGKGNKYNLVRSPTEFCGKVSGPKAAAHDFLRTSGLFAQSFFLVLVHNANFTVLQSPWPII